MTLNITAKVCIYMSSFFKKKKDGKKWQSTHRFCISIRQDVVADQSDLGRRSRPASRGRLAASGELWWTKHSTQHCIRASPRHVRHDLFLQRHHCCCFSRLSKPASDPEQRQEDDEVNRRLRKRVDFARQLIALLRANTKPKAEKEETY